MRSALDADSPSRSKVLACATAVALLLAGMGVAFVLIVSRRALSLVASALSFCWQLVAAIARGIAWEPVWYIALPACSVAGVQTRLPLVSSFWLAPAWWWLLGGRMWALLGSVLCLGNLLLLGRANYAMAVLAWTLLRGAFIFTSWWLRVPAVLIILAAWAFCFLAWLHALANADLNASVPPGELPVDVPKDADGEVARILGCRTYYEVLELGEATDEESVRKAHRRKGACSPAAVVFVACSRHAPLHVHSPARAPRQMLQSVRQGCFPARTGRLHAAERCAAQVSNREHC
jgi:hypothetical protein